MNQVIIVEDDLSILDTMTIILRNSGYGVTTFFDGKRVLKNDFIPPDIFIIDKQLAGVDGLDICLYLKGSEATKDIPVIMVSASPDIQILAKQAMADDALEKPFKMKALKDIVAKHIKNH